jgi:hypothetical protein
MAIMINHADGIVRNGALPPAFSEYPKLMSHPAFTLGTAAEEVKHPGGRIEYVGGTPVRFPPVTVNNPDDEEWYAAQGYVSQGKSDAKAFAQAVASAAAARTPNGYVPQEFPKWAGGVLCNNAEEEAAALAKRREQLGRPPAETAPVEAPQSADHDVVAAQKAEIEALKARMDEMMAEMRRMAAPQAQQQQPPVLSRQQKAALTRKARAAEKAA